MILLNKKYYGYVKALFFLNCTPLKPVISSFEISVTANLCLEKICELEATIAICKRLLALSLSIEYLAVYWDRSFQSVYSFTCSWAFGLLSALAYDK